MTMSNKYYFRPRPGASSIQRAGDAYKKFDFHFNNSTDSNFQFIFILNYIVQY